MGAISHHTTQLTGVIEYNAQLHSAQQWTCHLATENENKWYAIYYNKNPKWL